MSAWLGAFRAALSAAAWRGSDRPIPAPNAVHLVWLALASAALTALRAWIDGGDEGRFQLYGVNALLATEAAIMAVVVLFCSRRAALTQLVVLGCLFLMAGAGLLTAALLTPWLQDMLKEGGALLATVADWAGFAASSLYLIWLVGAIHCVLLSVEGKGSRRPMLRAVGAVIGTFAVAFVLPQWPLFAGNDFRRATANVYEIASVIRRAEADVDADSSKAEQGWAEIELAQADLLRQSLGRLATREPGASNLFVVGVAGWSDQKVFPSEIAGAVDVLDRRFATGARTVRLINHEDTAWDTPYASVQNLATVLHGVAERMDTERDAVILVLTSHGDRSGFALNYDPLVSRTLSPASLKSALDMAGIRNRIVIVSACHSGVFVPVLADENTAVITASSADRNSFGCSNEREWTYFGDAFFNQALREGGSLPDAFSKARDLIAGWESREGRTPSEPQMHVGSTVRALLPTLLGRADRIQARAGDTMHEQDLAVR